MSISQLFIGGGAGLAIGLTLGLLGGGGSILTVPALVYLAGQTPQAAVAASLVIVGANSTMGAFFHRTQGTLNWKIALIFGSSGMLTSYVAAGLSQYFSATALLVVFACLMLVVGIYMLVRQPPQAKDAGKPTNWFIVVGSGTLVGVLTGLLGVGGGFLIVPALVMLVGLPMQQAIGTSLVIIAMNSLASLLGHLGHTSLDLSIVGIFLIGGLAGTLLGSRLSKRINAKVLRRAFAIFVIVLGIFLLVDNLTTLI